MSEKSVNFSTVENLPSNATMSDALNKIKEIKNATGSMTDYLYSVLLDKGVPLTSNDKRMSTLISKVSELMGQSSVEVVNNYKTFEIDASHVINSNGYQVLNLNTYLNQIEDPGLVIIKSQAIDSDNYVLECYSCVDLEEMLWFYGTNVTNQGSQVASISYVNVLSEEDLKAFLVSINTNADHVVSLNATMHIYKKSAITRGQIVSPSVMTGTAVDLYTSDPYNFNYIDVDNYISNVNDYKNMIFLFNGNMFGAEHAIISLFDADTSNALDFSIPTSEDSGLLRKFYANYQYYPIKYVDVTFNNNINYIGIKPEGTIQSESNNNEEVYKTSIISILQSAGVSASTDETLGELIAKIDTALDSRVKPAGTAVAGNVLSGKTFINSTGQTITGTMTNRGGAQTVTPGTSNKTLYSGYYSGNITVQGDSDLIASNIKSGVNIFGVTGSYAGSSSSLTTKTINTEFGLDDIYNGSKTISVNMGSKTPSLIILNGYINITNSYYDDVTTVSEISMIGVNGTGFSGSNNGENEARLVIYNMLVDGTDLDIKFKIKSYTSSSITLQMIASDRDLVYDFCYDDCLLIFIQEVYYM
jgi:hypothetical protein